MVASEQHTLAAIQRSTREQAAAKFSLLGRQRQRSAVFLKAEKDREAAQRREQHEQERMQREQRRHGAASFILGAGAAAVSTHAVYGWVETRSWPALSASTPRPWR